MRRASLCLICIVFGINALFLPSAHGQEVHMARYWVMHEGKNIEVYGYMNKDGKVVWNPGLAENARPRERRDSPVEGPSRLPEGEARPNKSQSQDWQTNGVVRPATPAPVDRYTAHSEEAKRFVAEAVEAPPAAGKIHVTVIGNADERARVVNDIKTDPAFEGIRDDMNVQDYEPKDWPVNPELGFVPGKPAIIVQASKGPKDTKGGRVIYRTLDYAIGPKGLAEAIRKGRPDYNPDLDPGPHKPVTPSLPDVLGTDRDFLLAGLGTLAVLFIVLKKKE